MNGRIVAVGLAIVLALAGLAPGQPAKKAQMKKAQAKKPASPSHEGVKTEFDVEYALVGETSLRLDLYVPEAHGGPFPLVVWVHAGDWRSGSKSESPAIPLSRRGYVVASIDYRLTDEAPFPAQIQDCRAALRWLRASASTYQIDPNRVGVWGASAGGHLAALLGTSAENTRWDAVGGNPKPSCRVQAVCDYSGQSDFSSLPESNPTSGRTSAVARLLGGPPSEKKAEARQASPIAYVSKDDPPFLIVHGDLDRVVPLKQSEQLRDALNKVGVEATLVTVKNGRHGFGPESDPNPNQLREQVGAFFDRHLKPVTPGVRGSR